MSGIEYFVIIEISINFEIRILAVCIRIDIHEMSFLLIQPFCEKSLHDLLLGHGVT